MKSIYFLILIGLIVSSAGCSPKEEEMPIAEDIMVTILKDVHIAEAAVKKADVTVRDSLSKVYYNQIYHIHGKKEEEITSLLKYLQRNPKKMEMVYTKVLEEIGKEKGAQLKK